MDLLLDTVALPFVFFCLFPFFLSLLVCLLLLLLLLLSFFFLIYFLLSHDGTIQLRTLCVGSS